MRFGCCTSPDKIGLVKEMGFDYVELAVGSLASKEAESAFVEAARTIEAGRLTPEAFNCFIGGDNKLTGPDVSMERVRAHTETVFERVNRVGGKIVVVGSGGARKVPDGFPMEKGEEQLVEFFRMAGDIAADKGVTIVIEPLNRRETNIINSFPAGVEMARKVDHPAVQVLADFYHIDEENEDIDVVIDHGGMLRHTHTADTGRYQPGSGQYDYDAIFAALKKAGYDERMSIECGWHDFETEAPVSLQFLVDKAAQAGIARG